MGRKKHEFRSIYLGEGPLIASKEVDADMKAAYDAIEDYRQEPDGKVENARNAARRLALTMHTDLEKIWTPQK